MKSNQALQTHIQYVINWEPLLEAARIRVSVKDDVVTLTQTVHGYLKKIDAKDTTGILLKVSGITVTLKGAVISNYQKDEAERIAWNAPGVWHVENSLVIENYPVFAE